MNAAFFSAVWAKINKISVEMMRFFLYIFVQWTKLRYFSVFFIFISLFSTKCPNCLPNGVILRCYSCSLFVWIQFAVNWKCAAATDTYTHTHKQVGKGRYNQISRSIWSACPFARSKSEYGKSRREKSFHGKCPLAFMHPQPSTPFILFLSLSRSITTTTTTTAMFNRCQITLISCINRNKTFLWKFSTKCEKLFYRVCCWLLHEIVECHRGILISVSVHKQRCNVEWFV